MRICGCDPRATSAMQGRPNGASADWLAAKAMQHTAAIINKGNFA